MSETSVLLVKRKDNELWDIPGGGKHWFETLTQAARRELYEETGLSVKETTYLGKWSHTHTYPDGNVVLWTTHVFTAQRYSGELKANDDVKEARWWPLSSMPTEISVITSHYLEALQSYAKEIRIQ